MEINREKLAWAGGLFEGEGTFALRKRSTNSPRGQFQLQLIMTDLDVLERLQYSVGGLGRLSGPCKRYKEHHKWRYIWSTTNFEDTQAVLAFIWPWLNSRRQARAKQCMITYVADQHNFPPLHTKPSKFFTNENKEIRKQNILGMKQAGFSLDEIADTCEISRCMVNRHLRNLSWS